MANCLYCNVELVNKKASAKYCCEQHRVNHAQNLNTAKRKLLETENSELKIKVVDLEAEIVILKKKLNDKTVYRN